MTTTLNIILLVLGLVFVLGYTRAVPFFSYPARALLFCVLLGFAAFLGFLEGLILKPFGLEGIVQFITARTFQILCLPFLGIKVEIDDPENWLGSVRPSVIISNHQSMVDIVVLGATFPPWCSVTAKKALKYYPLLGWFMAVSKTVFIDRAKRDDALKAFANAKEEVLRDRQNIFMFPEGTRSYFDKPDLLPFKKGAFHFAQQAQIPIVPFVVCNYTNIWSDKRKLAVPGVIKVKVLPPVETKGLKADDVGELCEKVRKDMLEVSHELGYAIRK